MDTQKIEIFSGMPVVLWEHHYRFTSVWFRRPRTKRKRIVKKWKRNRRNWRSEKKPSDPLIMGGKLVMHPDTWRQIKTQMDRRRMA